MRSGVTSITEDRTLRAQALGQHTSSTFVRASAGAAINASLGPDIA